MKKPRIVITGASGFIGTNLVKKLLKNGYKNIVAIDKNKFSDNSVKTAIGNFNDSALLNKVIRKNDIVIHLACSTVPALSESDKEKDIKENVFGTLKLLKISTNKKINKFIFFSSGGTVYGDKNYPVSEEAETSPINSHGSMKLMIENDIKIFNRQHGLNYVIIRPSNPYGREKSNKKNQGVIDIFLKKIINNETLEIWGDGKIIRDYIYIDDLTDLVAKTIESAVSNEILNAGSGQGTSINDIIKIIGKITNKKIKVKYLSARNFDTPYNVLDVRKAKTILNWEPSTKLGDGIRKIYDKLKNV